MLKNSSILSLFGLGLILSTSPLFALMDSSIDEISTVGITNGEEELEEIEEEEEEIVEEEEDEIDSEDSSSVEEAVVDVQASEPSSVALPSTPTIQLESTPSASTATKEAAATPKVSTASVSSQKTTSQGKGTSKVKRKYVRDYKSRKKTDSRGVFKVDFDDGEEEKYLYSIDKDVDFSLTDEEWNKYQKTPENKIKISLFKNTAWKNKDTSVDEYEELGQEQVKELFNLEGEEGKEKAKLKQLLVSLSNRREWKFHENLKNFNSEEMKAELDAEGNLNLKLKYFLNYEELKEYAVPKAKECAKEKKRCVASPEDLIIIDQDKKSFFEGADIEKPKN